LAHLLLDSWDENQSRRTASWRTLSPSMAIFLFPFSTLRSPIWPIPFPSAWRASQRRSGFAKVWPNFCSSCWRTLPGRTLLIFLQDIIAICLWRKADMVVWNGVRCLPRRGNSRSNFGLLIEVRYVDVVEVLGLVGRRLKCEQFVQVSRACILTNYLRKVDIPICSIKDANFI
jgi:hypothetical protein